MGVGLLRAESFVVDGITVMLDGSGDYEGNFLVDFDIASQFPLEAVLAEAPGQFPSFIRGDPQDRVLPIHIEIARGAASSQAQIDTLKSAFSPFRGTGYLKVRDNTGTLRRMAVKSLGLTPWESHSSGSYVASLEAPEPIWEADAAVSPTLLISGSAAAGHTWVVNNPGNERAFPQITLLNPLYKGAANHWRTRRPVNIAWRSPLEGVDSLGGPYPTNITDGLLNTAALVGAGQMQADGDDLRVLLDGVEQDRWLGNMNTTGTHAWVNIPWQPAVEATLAANMTAGTPTVGGLIESSNPEGTNGFPDSGFIIIDSEVIHYSSKTATAFVVGARGGSNDRGTTAASHTAGATIRWMEHLIDILYNYSAAGAPPASADRQPIFNLDSSNNNAHNYTTSAGFTDPDSLRSGQWLRERRGTNLGASVMALSQSAGVLSALADLPSGGAPNFDSVSLYTPCFATGNVVMDYLVGHGLLFEMFNVDTGGFESLVALKTAAQESGLTYAVGTPSFSTAVNFALASAASRLTLQARNWVHTGALSTVSDFGVGFGGARIAQAFRLTEDSLIYGFVFNAKKSVAGTDGSVNVDIEHVDPVAGPDKNVGPGIISVPASALATTYRLVSVFPSPVPYAADLYAASFERSAGSVVGIIYVGGRLVSIYVAGSRWHETAPGVWADDDPEDLGLLTFGLDAENQPDATFELGQSVQWRNLRVAFDTNYTPYVILGSPSDTYWFDATLENLTTGQMIALSFNRSLDALALAIIDTAEHTAICADSLAAALNYSILQGMEPEDIHEWMRLDPGNNTLRYTEPSIGSALIGVGFSYRARWT